ncbi:MAG: hypothetical protein GY758_21315 [Fuerstiella sp.]|jgi:hypothetical protein|nr:hypothetical protein [Fuerstiella sp.]
MPLHHSRNVALCNVLIVAVMVAVIPFIAQHDVGNTFADATVGPGLVGSGL